MGNIFTDALGKIASNVTQSVASALIVTAITTYLIVSPGKKDEKGEGSKKDSATTSTTVVPVETSGTVKEQNHSTSPSSDAGSLEKPAATGSASAAGNVKVVAGTATETKGSPPKKESPATEASTKAYKDLPPETPAEVKLERTITEGRAKGDSLLKANPKEEKARDVKKEEKKETKDVKKRADEVFDELDQETQK